MGRKILFDDSNLVVVHDKRVTLMPKDMQLIPQLCKVKGGMGRQGVVD